MISNLEGRVSWALAIAGSGRSLLEAARAYSREPGMPRVGAVLAVTILVISCASCRENSDNPAVSIPSARPSTAMASPSATLPPELAKFSVEQRLAYGGASHSYSAFLRGNSQILADGKTTKMASSFYRHYSLDWSQAWGNLVQLASNEVTVRGPTRLLSVHPTSVVLAPSRPTVVVFSRCLDESRVVVRQSGKVLAQPQLEQPHEYLIRAEKRSPQEAWRFGTAKRGARC